MSVPETPRTWTLNFENGLFFPLADGKVRSDRIEVVEKAPVDAERERMLEEINEASARARQAGGLSMAVACVAFAWKRDSEAARAMRGDVMHKWGFTAEEWNRQITQLAEYTQRKGGCVEDIEQFLRVAFTGQSPSVECAS